MSYVRFVAKASNIPREVGMAITDLWFDFKRKVDPQGKGAVK
jgi:hypothetical protein